MGVVVVGETPSLTGESVGEAHGVLERTQTHPPANWDLKGTTCLWEVREVMGDGARAEQAGGIVPSLTPPY